MMSACCPFPPLWPGSMTITLWVIPPPVLALLVEGSAVAALVVDGGLVAGAFEVDGSAWAVEGGSTRTVVVTVAGPSDTVVVGGSPEPPPGAAVVRVTVTAPPFAVPTLVPDGLAAMIDLDGD